MWVIYARTFKYSNDKLKVAKDDDKTSEQKFLEKSHFTKSPF